MLVAYKQNYILTLKKKVTYKCQYLTAVTFNGCKMFFNIGSWGEQTYCRKTYQYKMPKDFLRHFAKFFSKNIVLVQNAEIFIFQFSISFSFHFRHFRRSPILVSVGAGLLQDLVLVSIPSIAGVLQMLQGDQLVSANGKCT